MHRLRGGQRTLYYGCVVGHGQDLASFHGDRSLERKWRMSCQRLQSLTDGRKLSKNPPAQRRVCATVTIMRSLEQARHTRRGSHCILRGWLDSATCVAICSLRNHWLVLDCA